MKVYLAADHGGYEYKQKLIDFLKSRGDEPVDCGNFELKSDDDYPDFVIALAQKMQQDPDSRGIVLCRNGVGVSILANRYSHLRCGLGFSDQQVKKARLDDDINVLAIPADYLSFEQAEFLVKVFLETEFSNLERHSRRLAKINSLFT